MDKSAGEYVPKGYPATYDACSLSTTQGDQPEAGLSHEETTSLLRSSGNSTLYAATENAIDSSATDSWVGYEEFAGLPWHKRPSVFSLLAPYVLLTLAFGGSIVPKLNLIIELLCRRYSAEQTALTPVALGADTPQCAIPEVQRDVATFTLVLNLITGVLSAYSVPKIGSLSDRYGRCKLLAFTSAGGVLNELVTILAARYPDAVHYRWLILGAMFEGLAGSFTAGSVLTNSYTSDCTPPSKRGAAIGYLHSCLFAGLALGPLLAGYLVKYTGSLLSVFYVSLGCHIVFNLSVVLIVPESVSQRRQMLAREKHRVEREAHHQRMREWACRYLAAAQGSQSRFWSWLASAKYADCFASIRFANPCEPLKILVPEGVENRRVRRNLLLLATMDMAIVGAALGSLQVILLYSEYVFHWGNFETSRFISLMSLVRVIFLMGIFSLTNYVFRIRPAQKRYRDFGPIKEQIAGADNLDVWILRFAIFSDVAGACGYVFARSEALFVLSGIIAAFGGPGSATIQAALSKHVPAERVGQLLGAIGLLHSVSRIVAPTALNGLYAVTVKSFPQAAFVAIGAVSMATLGLSMFVRPHIYMEAEDVGEEGRPARPSTPRVDTLVEDDVVPTLW